MKNTDKKVKQWTPFSMDKRLQPIYSKALITAFAWASKEKLRIKNAKKRADDANKLFGENNEYKFLTTNETGINLMRLYASIGVTSRPQQQAVLAAFNIFFQRKSRGDQNTGKASTWIVRSKNLLTQTAFNSFLAMQTANKSSLISIFDQLYAKGESAADMRCVDFASLFDDTTFASVMTEANLIFQNENYTIEEFKNKKAELCV